MDPRNIKTALAGLGLIAAILACNFPSSGNATEAPPTETPTMAVGSPTASSGAPSDAITHQVIPVSLPANRSSHAGDYDSSKTAKNKAATGGDFFPDGKFERPFNANTMDVYFPNLDIIDTFVYQDDTWIYGTITLVGPDSNNAFTGKYALELDLDRDGKGDWLVMATNPSSTDWSVNGVQVYQDKNKDVGGVTAMRTDEHASDGDGFETLVFDQGKGDDPDTAWVRISPAAKNTIEIAVKRSVLGNPDKYLINMWAGTSSLDPALFDINDHFTHTQAGAADPGYQLFYPIKQVAEIDNSCRMAVGFEPTGKEPGLCQVFVPVVIEPTKEPPPPQPTEPPPAPPACKPDPHCVGCGYTWNTNTCSCDVVPC